MCFDPPPLIMGRFTRENYPEWAVGGPYAVEDLFFSTMIGALGRCGWEKGDDWMLWLVGYFCRQKRVLKYPNLRASGPLTSKYKKLYIPSYFYLITFWYYFLCKVTLLITILQIQWWQLLSGLMREKNSSAQVITAGGWLIPQQWLFSTQKMN